MTDRVLIPLPGIGTLSLTRAEYDAALIPIPPPEIFKPAPTPTPVEVTQPRRQGLHYIRLREVCSRVSLRPSSLYRLIQLGRFPKQVKLSERTAAWIESEVEAFMDARIVERDGRASVSAPPASLYLRMGDVMKRTGLSHAMIYDGVRNGTFPKWADLPKRASEWLKADVEAWLASRDSRKKKP
jgi:prophage regulatory protein